MAYFTPRISMVQNLPLAQIVPIGSVSGTVTGTAGYGSSLFLQRLFIPGQLNITEFDQAVGMAFSATTNGAGTVSKSLMIYSFGNSTSLASVASISGSSTWASGTTTVAGSTSYTQFQAGWAGSVIQAMTFASTQIEPGEYVIGQLMNFAQAASTWTVSLFGASAETVTSGGVSMLSSGGLAAVSGLQATTSGSVLSTVGVSGSGLAVGAASLTSIKISFAASSAAASSSTIFSSQGSITFSNSAGSIQPILSLSITGSLLTSTASFGALSASGLSSGSFFGSSTATLGLTGAGVGALPAFTYFGTGSGPSGVVPAGFIAGIMSTGAIPSSLALTAAGLTVTGSAPLAQPWFALIGA
jgi:hypothetical protein